MRRRSRMLLIAALAAALGLLPVGCREEQPRVYKAPKESGAGAAARGMDGRGGPVPVEVQYRLPADWRVDPEPRPMRQVTFVAGQGPDAAEVYISRAGGDLTANLNMWRGQVGLPPVGHDEAVRRLTRVPTADGEAALADLSADSGSPRGAGAATGPDESSPSAASMAHGASGPRSGRILVAIIPAPGENVFVKMQGSESAVEQQREQMLAFVGSIRLVRAGADGGPPRTVPDTPAAPGVPAAGPGFSCELPDGWSADPGPRPPLLAVYSAGPVLGEFSRAVSITVSSLPGDGGGLLANVNRWRNTQLGLPRVGSLDEQPTNAVTVDGRPGSLVDLVGVAAGERPLTRIVVATVRRGGSTWFFRMSGPPEAVEAQRRAFDAFLESVRFARPPE